MSKELLQAWREEESRLGAVYQRMSIFFEQRIAHYRELANKEAEGKFSAECAIARKGVKDAFDAYVAMTGQHPAREEERP